MAYFILGDIYQLQELEIWIDMWNIILSPSFRIFCCFQKCSCWSPEMLYFFSFCKLIFWRIFFLFGGYLLSQSWIWKILHMPNKDKKHNFATVCINSTHRSIVFLPMLPTVPMATHSIQLILDIFPIFELFGRPCSIIKFFTLRQWNQTQNWSRSMEQFKDV